MLKSDKAELRRLIRTGSPLSDERMAERCDCTIGTVKKYRRALASDRKL